MKTLKITLFIIAISFITVDLSAQLWGSKDAGPLQEEVRKVEDFDAISVSGGIDLYIYQSDDQEVVVKASDNVIGRIKTEVKKGSLHLFVEKGKWFNNVKMEVHVTVDNLDALRASGGSDVYSKGTFQSDDFEIHASGGSDIEMALEVENLECHLSGGADTDLTGVADNLEIHASGGSDFEGYDLKAKHVVVDASGASDSSVFASESIDVRASGSSDVDFKGNPSKTNISSSGSSDVNGH